MAEQNAKITDKQLKEIQQTQGKVNQILNNIGMNFVKLIPLIWEMYQL